MRSDLMPNFALILGYYNPRLNKRGKICMYCGHNGKPLRCETILSGRRGEATVVEHFLASAAYVAR